MEATAKTTTGSRRRKAHSGDRYNHLRLLDSEYLPSTASNQHIFSDHPDADELRRVRTEFYKKSPEDRRRESHREMDTYTAQRRHPRSRRSSIKTPESITRELRRDHEFRHRHRREKYKEESEDAAGYVYQQVYDNPMDSDYAKTAPRRRASAPRATSRYEAERVRVQEPSLTRRHTERRVSSRREAGVEQSGSQRRSDHVAATPRPLIIRSASTREKSTKLGSRPPLVRSHSATHKARHPFQSHLALPIILNKVERKVSDAKRGERPPSILGSIFGMPKPHDAKPERQVECLTCLSSDIPISKSAKLACKHRMCHSCLRRIFTMSVNDPQHMPPKCCTQDHIPLKHVEKLFDTRFKMKWNQKYQEYTTKNRIYCPAKGCGEWIKPSHIHVDTSGGANTGRKYGKCSRCRTKVCCTCNGKWHSSRECPKDEATQRFAEIAKKEGWQRCFNCSATVELKEGCNHMTCRCRAEFCMICGLKWKTCDCPWFNYQAVENDRLHHMNIPRRVPFPGDAPLNPALGYQEEMDRRREQERRDENLARRMQALGLDGVDENNNFLFPPIPPLPPVDLEFVHRTAEMISGAAMHAMATAQNVPYPIRPPHIPRPPPIALPPQPPQPPPVNAPAHSPYIPYLARQQPPLRHHSVASRQYNNHAQTRPSERVVPRRAVADYELEAQSHRPTHGADVGERMSLRMGSGGALYAGAPPAAVAVADTGAGAGAGAGAGGPEGPGLGRTGARHSAMAGLTRGSGEGRVDEWRRHIGEE